MGVPWSRTPSSDAKLNYMEIISGTGAELAALDKTKHTLVRCTSTGSGFTIDRVYLFSADGTTAIDLSGLIDHTHTGEGDGGRLAEITGHNQDSIDLLLTKTDDLKKAQWIETVTSTGTIEDNTDGTTGERAIRLRTNGTSGATATISYPHLDLGFAAPSYFASKVRIETATSCAGHIGVGADDTSAADSNTRKYQAEWCTTTNNNWFLRTATGSAQSGSDSGIAITANRTGVGIDCQPLFGTPEADLWISATNVLQKTSNIPVDSSTAKIRPLLVYGCRLSYNTAAEWVYRT